MYGTICANGSLIVLQGDRMWGFAVGLYLVYLSGGVLRLAAIYGFCAGMSALLLGGIIGNWVDRTGRMRGRHLSPSVP